MRRTVHNIIIPSWATAKGMPCGFGLCSVWVDICNRRASECFFMVEVACYMKNAFFVSSGPLLPFFAVFSRGGLFHVAVPRGGGPSSGFSQFSLDLILLLCVSGVF